MTARRASLAFICALATTVAFQPSSVAHHSFAAEFDANSPVELRGKVTKVEWVNPHPWIHMLVEVKDKKPQAWMVETGTLNTLLRSGINRDSLKIGTVIVVRGYQSKDHSCTPACRANGRSVTLPNGQTLFIGSSGTGAPADGADSKK
jgi:uncharacterized protein DUF6152